MTRQPQAHAPPEDAGLKERARLVEEMARRSWDALPSGPRLTMRKLEFSGLRPLEDPLLLPFLERPGVFLILGPGPDFPILHLGATQGPIQKALETRMERRGSDGFTWRWEARSTPPPSHLACITFVPGGVNVWKMKALIQEQLVTAISEG